MSHSMSHKISLESRKKYLYPFESPLYPVKQTFNERVYSQSVIDYVVDYVYRNHTHTRGAMVLIIGKIHEPWRLLKVK